MTLSKRPNYLRSTIAGVLAAVSTTMGMAYGAGYSALGRQSDKIEENMQLADNAARSGDSSLALRYLSEAREAVNSYSLLYLSLGLRTPPTVEKKLESIKAEINRRAVPLEYAESIMAAARGDYDLANRHIKKGENLHWVVYRDNSSPSEILQDLRRAAYEKITPLSIAETEKKMKRNDCVGASMEAMESRKFADRSGTNHPKLRGLEAQVRKFWKNKCSR